MKEQKAVGIQRFIIVVWLGGLLPQKLSDWLVTKAQHLQHLVEERANKMSDKSDNSKAVIKSFSQLSSYSLLVLRLVLAQ